MTGRDPHEIGRAATTLELLYDLVFVVAIGQAADQIAHLVAEGHYLAGIGMSLKCWSARSDSDRLGTLWHVAPIWRCQGSRRRSPALEAQDEATFLEPA